MAEKQCLKAPKEEERETKEEEGEGEKPVPKLQDSVISVGVVDCLTEEKKKKKKKKRGTSQEETLGGSLVNSSKAENLEELDVKPMVATPLDSFDPVEFKAQLGLSHQEALSSVTAQAHANLQLQTEHPHSVLETSLSSLKPSMSSALGASPLQQVLPALEPDHSVCKTEEDLEDSSDQELKFPHGTVKTQANDGFNWRKYGQKLVKSSESSRSYYRCTTRNCHAKKKVERCDHTGNLINTIYKGQHNHEPPRKIRCTKARRCASSAGPGELIGAVDCPVTLVIDSDLFGYKREFRQLSPAKQLHSARDYNGAIGVKAEEEHCHERYSKEEHFDEPQSKRSKMKGRSDTHSLKPVKEQKVVVQAPGDVGISGDGYRWRKYGQKMVKGNPNPRSYYKCTSAGCPVRKHVERATDDTSALKITYEGKHDHDMPVPKKRQGPPSATLLIAAAAAAMNSAQLKKPEPLANNKISAQWSMDMEGQLKNQKASEFGGEKALESAQKVSPLESARTLLSIGIELRPY